NASTTTTSSSSSDAPRPTDATCSRRSCASGSRRATPMRPARSRRRRARTGRIGGADRQHGDCTMRTTWVVVADEGLARIFEIPGRNEDLVELETLTYAPARADAADLRRDAYGRRAGGGTLSGSYLTASAGEDELHREAELFARRLAQWMLEKKRAHAFEAL